MERQASRPDASPRSASAASLRPTAVLFGATEIEGGFPHSEISGSKPVRGSPKLIAAYHVLHRLSAPRHPPDTLKTLDCSHRQSAFFFRPRLGVGDKRTLARKDQFCFKRIRRPQRSSLDLRLVLKGPDCRDEDLRRLGLTALNDCVSPHPALDRMRFLFTMSEIERLWPKAAKTF